MSLSSNMSLAVLTLEFVFKAIKQKRSMQGNGMERDYLDAFCEECVEVRMCVVSMVWESAKRSGGTFEATFHTERHVWHCTAGSSQKKCIL